MAPVEGSRAKLGRQAGATAARVGRCVRVVAASLVAEGRSPRSRASTACSIRPWRSACRCARRSVVKTAASATGSPSPREGSAPLLAGEPGVVLNLLGLALEDSSNRSPRRGMPCPWKMLRDGLRSHPTRRLPASCPASTSVPALRVRSRMPARVVAWQSVHLPLADQRPEVSSVDGSTAVRTTLCPRQRESTPTGRSTALARPRVLRIETSKSDPSDCEPRALTAHGETDHVPWSCTPRAASVRCGSPFSSVVARAKATGGSSLSTSRQSGTWLVVRGRARHEALRAPRGPAHRSV